jgi:DNA-binding transcriptional LysR family regulator
VVQKISFNDNELRILYELSCTRSLSLAAETLKIAQPNISRTLQQLEDRFGFSVFDRSCRPIKLTRFGEELLPYVKKHMKSCEDIQKFTMAYKLASDGFVRIHAPTGQLLFISKYVIPGLKAQHPEIKLMLTTSNLSNAEFTLGVPFSDDCDILFTHSLPDNDELIARNIASIPANIYGTRDMIARYPIHSIEDYGHSPCILFFSHMEDNHNIWYINDDSHKEIRKIIISGDFACDNSYAAIELAKAGLGYLFMPELIIKETDIDGLVPTLPDNFSTHLDLFVIYSKKTQQPFRVQLIINSIVNILKKLLPR